MDGINPTIELRIPNPEPTNVRIHSTLRNLGRSLEAATTFSLSITSVLFSEFSIC
jgi:hypothetical protein